MIYEISERFGARYHLIFLTNNIDKAPFIAFFRKNGRKLAETKTEVGVLSYELESSSEAEKNVFNKLISANIVKIIETGSMDAFMEQYSGRKKPCLVIPSVSDANTIKAKAKDYYFPILVCHLSEEGEIEDSLNLNRNTSPEKNDEHNRLAEIQVNHDPEQKKEPPKELEKPQTPVDERVKTASPKNIEAITNITSIQRIPVRTSLREGDYVFDSKGKAYCLQIHQMNNNSAKTYSTNDDEMWVKIYDDSALTNYRQAKIQTMLTVQMDCTQTVCWPLDYVVDQDGVFRGYIHKRIEGEPIYLTVFNRAGLQKAFPTWDKRDLCYLSLAILQTIEEIHKAGVFLGCINPAAIRVVDSRTVVFTDTDNYQIGPFPSFSYNLSFTPPEFIGKKIFLTNMDAENFAVATLLFMIMMNGKSPYLAGVTGNPEETIKRMNFLFSNWNVRNRRILPGVWKFMWSHLSNLRNPFIRTFQKEKEKDSSQNTNKKTGYNTGRRKSVNFWIYAIKEYLKDIQKPENRESLALYPDTFRIYEGDTVKRCKYCGREYPIVYFDKQYKRYDICNSCLGEASEVGFTCENCGKHFVYTRETALFHEMQREADPEWKKQRHCADCRSKVESCRGCGKLVPFYNLRDGYCWDCNQTRKIPCSNCAKMFTPERLINGRCNRCQVVEIRRCKSCGTRFEITKGEKDYLYSKGYSLPQKCRDCRGSRDSGGNTRSRGNNWRGWFF